MQYEINFLIQKLQKKKKIEWTRRLTDLENDLNLRVSMGLAVIRKTAKNLAVRRKNERVLTVSRKKKSVNRKKSLTTK